MKTSRKAPYIFITILVALLIFTLGTRYGQKVEKTNKTISYLLSITPTKIITPSAEPTIAYKIFSHENCGISFLKPTYLNPEGESSTGAKLISKKDESIEFNCSEDINPTQKLDQKIATDSIRINNKTIITTKKEQKIDGNKVNVHQFNLTNTLNKKSLTFKVSENLLPIFTQTFEFLP